MLYQIYETQRALMAPFAEFGVYGVDSGRICVAALNDHNLDRVAAALAQVA